MSSNQQPKVNSESKKRKDDVDKAGGASLNDDSGVVEQLFNDDQMNSDRLSSEQNSEDLQWEEYKDHKQPVQLAQSFVYDLILKNIYKD